MVMVLDMAKGSFNDETSSEALDNHVGSQEMTPALALQEYDFVTAPPQLPVMPVELAEMDTDSFLALNESC